MYFTNARKAASVPLVGLLNPGLGQQKSLLPNTYYLFKL